MRGGGAGGGRILQRRLLPVSLWKSCHSSCTTTLKRIITSYLSHRQANMSQSHCHCPNFFIFTGKRATLLALDTLYLHTSSHTVGCCHMGVFRRGSQLEMLTGRTQKMAPLRIRSLSEGHRIDGTTSQLFIHTLEYLLVHRLLHQIHTT